MITIIAIVGKTASGKDTIAKYMKKVYDIKPIVSYTDRPIREGETNGIEHWFISKEEMNELLIQNKKDIMAYTKFPKTGYRYCASSYLLKNNKIYTYIIDPPGLEYLKKFRPDINLYTIYVDLEEEEIIKRALKRGDKEEIVLKRLDSERDIFNRFKDSNEYDALIYTKESIPIIEKDISIILNSIGL